MNQLKNIISVFLFSVCSLSLQAQPIMQYPVQVTTQVTQHTPYAPQYYSGMMPKLRVTINNLDFQSPPLQVVVRMKITSSTFSLYTPEYLRVFFTTLDAGMPLQLSGEDLAVFFHPENFQSTNKAGFLRSQQFPDGLYSFHFEVFDAATGRQLSSPVLGRATVFIRLGEPPRLNVPERGKIISETPIPNIMFSWQPAHNLTSGYNTAYEFSMVELYDKKTNPEGAFDYSRVLLTETVHSTAFIYTAAHPMLIPGMRYAWRVRAVAKDGLDDVNIIKNNGFSQVFWFDYAADCHIVTTLGAIYENNKVNITWQDVNAMNYTVEYRKKNSSKWYTGEITQPELCTVYNLKNGIEYEYRVGSRCVINDAYQYSDIKGIKIPSKEDLQQERQRNCGIMPDTKITNKTPIEQLIPGQPVLAGDFPVFISKVSGSGRFTGEGYVGIPYIGNLKVAVTFKDIVVNTDNRLISGYFETKYDAVNNMTVDLDENKNTGKDVGDNRTEEEKATYKVDYTINPDITALPVKADGLKDEITESGDYTLTKGENGKYTLVLTDSEGQEHNIETDKLPTTIQDKDGKIYQIDEKGKITSFSDYQQDGVNTFHNNEEESMRIYFIIKKLDSNATPTIEEIERIAKENKQYYSSNSKISLNEGKYLCIPIRKQISYSYYNINKAEEETIIKNPEDFLPYGMVNDGNWTFKALSWSENPYNTYTVQHQHGTNTQSKEYVNYILLDLIEGISDSLSVAIPSIQHKLNLTEFGDGISNDLPQTVRTSEENIRKIIRKINPYLSYYPGTLKIEVEKHDAEAVWFDIDELTYNGTFGFDRYNDKKLSAFTDKYKEKVDILKTDGTKIDYRVPNISAWTNYSVTIKAEINKNTALSDSIYYEFVAGNGLIIERIQCNGVPYNDGIFKAKNGNYTLNITLKSSVAKAGLLVKDKNGKTVGKLNYYSKDRTKSKSISYKVVNVTFGSTPQGMESETVILDNYTTGSLLENYFNNNSFNQTFYQFSYNGIDSLVITDAAIRNKGITANASFLFNNSTANMRNISELLEQKYTKYNEGERIIFLINNREMIDYNGFANTPKLPVQSNTKHSIIIFKSALTNWEVLTHEVGHTFGLQHPFDTNGFVQGNTTNYMDYTRKRNMFWHWQWVIMNKNDFK